jgi:predicted ester cyclase
MNTWRRIAIGTAVIAATVGGVTAAANAQTTNTRSTGQSTAQSHDRGSDRVRDNEKVVNAFMRDVLNEHHGADAAKYFTPDMAWHGGTIGTVSGSANVTGLLTTVVTSIPDLHTATQDMFGQGDEVVVRLIVSGTQTGPLLGIPATGRHVQWDATDTYRLKDGKIAEEWAAEDLTAILADTGTYKAPWIQ